MESTSGLSELLYFPGSTTTIAGEVRHASQATLNTLADWTAMAQGAFAPNTIRAWKADWEIFSASCHTYRFSPMPASAKTVRDFVFDCMGWRKKPATIRRYIATIGRAHRAAGVPDPTTSEDVKLALKEMSRGLPSRQKQARALVWAEIKLFLTIPPRNLRDVRDRALVTVAYHTMCRREELVSCLVKDIDAAEDSTGSILVRRSKTDTTGEGSVAYLSPLTMRLIREWLDHTRRQSGKLFARVVGNDRVADAISAQSVTAILQRVGIWIGLERKEWGRISGHSCRVGATQDLLSLNMDLPSVMQAARWKDTPMPVRYGEKVLASRDAMARAAKSQGRA